MATSLKVDEDLSEEVSALLGIAGFDVTSILGQGWKGRKDPQIWSELQGEGRALVTGDKGFAQLAARPPHHGVVLLRPERESRVAFLRLARLAVDSGMLNDLENAILVVTETRLRIRRMK